MHELYEHAFDLDDEHDVYDECDAMFNVWMWWFILFIT